MSLIEALTNPARPVFLFGSTPPREDTTVEKARESCAKFAARSAVLATDGFIVYDIQDEGSRETSERPFPFRKTMDPSLYASFFPSVSGKDCVVYKCVINENSEQYGEWMNRAIYEHGHRAFNLVGAASSSQLGGDSLNLQEAGQLTAKRGDCKFGCVCIPERHTVKGTEHTNLLRKSNFGAEWFITQGIFASAPLIQLMTDYSELCRQNKTTPKKMILTFAPCGRPKTMTFIKWLGMHVPTEIEERIFSASSPVQESIAISCEILREVLAKTNGLGIPLGINVESLSIFKEEIDAAHELFQKLQVRDCRFFVSALTRPLLQAILLNSFGSPWTIRWFFVDDPINRIISSHPSTGSFSGLIENDKASQERVEETTAIEI